MCGTGGQRKTVRVFLFCVTALSTAQPVQRQAVRWMQSWSNWRYYLCICLERLRKITRNPTLIFGLKMKPRTERLRSTGSAHLTLTFGGGGKQRLTMNVKKHDYLQHVIEITSQRKC